MALFDTKGEIRVLNASINLSSGDKITESEAEQIAALSRNQDRARSFGVDLLMFAEGDLFVDGRPYEKKDLELVTGVYNYAQDITHRLMTTRGTMPGDSGFGVPWADYIGVSYANPSNLIRTLVAEITDELYKDYRTDEVISVRAEFSEPTILNLQCTITPVQFNIDVEIALLIGV